MTELKKRRGEIEFMKIDSFVKNQMKCYNMTGNKNSNFKRLMCQLIFSLM